MNETVRFILIGVVVCLAALTISQCQVQSTSGREIARSSLVFNHVIIDPTPPSGSGCCLDVLSIGDIDGDAQADIMVGSENSIGAVWYHYPSWTRYVIGRGDFTTDGEIADLDRDGDGDLVISSISRDAIEWWENTGNPFEESGWVRHEIGERFSHDIAIGDLNRDGNLDVAIFRKDSPRQLTWFEAPDDPLEKWNRYEIDTPPGEGLDLGDLDGDGDLDIAASHNWYENRDGKGFRWSKHSVTSSWGNDSRDIIADINGDGKQDILLSHAEGEGRVSWFENPTWREHVIEPDSLKGCHSLEAGDFDLDGDLDVFMGEMNTGGGKVMVYENLGDATTWQRLVLATTGTHNALIGDIGSDGALDIVGKNYTGPKVVEMWKNTTGRERNRGLPSQEFGLALLLLAIALFIFIHLPSREIAQVDKYKAVKMIAGKHRETKAVRIEKNANQVFLSQKSDWETRVTERDEDEELKIVTIAEELDLHL